MTGGQDHRKIEAIRFRWMVTKCGYQNVAGVIFFAGGLDLWCLESSIQQVFVRINGEVKAAVVNLVYFSDDFRMEIGRETKLCYLSILRIVQ